MHGLTSTSWTRACPMNACSSAAFRTNHDFSRSDGTTTPAWEQRPPGGTSNNINSPVRSHEIMSQFDSSHTTRYDLIQLYRYSTHPKRLPIPRDHYYLEVPTIFFDSHRYSRIISEMRPIHPRVAVIDPVVTNFTSMGSTLQKTHNNLFRWLLHQIDDDTWNLAGWLVIKRQAEQPTSGIFWPDSVSGGYFTLSEAPSRYYEDLSSHMWLESFYQDDQEYLHAGCTWVIGDASLVVETRRDTEQVALHETLTDLRERNLSFKTPEVIWNKTHGDYDYTLCTNVPGQPLSDIWSVMSEASKQRVVEQVAKAHDELALWQQDSCSAVRGRINLNLHVPPPRESIPTHYPHEVPGRFGLYGYDCSKFVFSHNCLVIDRIMVDEQGEFAGIKGWTSAAFVPKDLIRTQMRYGHLFRGLAYRQFRGALPFLMQFEDFSNRMDAELEKMGYGINSRDDLEAVPKHPFTRRTYQTYESRSRQQGVQTSITY